jgi:hypothetical protein
VSMEVALRWNVAACSLVGINRRFRGDYCILYRVTDRRQMSATYGVVQQVFLPKLVCKNLFLFFPIRTSFPAHRCVLDFTTLIVV